MNLKVAFSLSSFTRVQTCLALVTTLLALSVNAQVPPFPTEGCSVRYLYDETGNRTVREWHCWGTVKSAEQDPVLLGNSLRSFPSPTSSNLTVQLENEVEGAKLDIVDAQGKSVLSQRFTGTNIQLDVSDLVTGIYWIKIMVGTEMMFSSFRVE